MKLKKALKRQFCFVVEDIKRIELVFHFKKGNFIYVLKVFIQT